MVNGKFVLCCGKFQTERTIEIAFIFIHSKQFVELKHNGHFEVGEKTGKNNTMKIMFLAYYYYPIISKKTNKQFPN